MIQRFVLSLVAAVLLAGCSDPEPTAMPEKKVTTQQESKAADLTATALYFEESERGVDPYGSRMLINADFLRLDDGMDGSDFILYDRNARVIYSVAHAEKNILRINHHPVEIEPPYELKLVDDLRKDGSAPLIGTGQPEHHVYMVNSQRCFDAVLVPGVLDEEAKALSEYLEVLAGEQARNLFKTPVEFQGPCMLSNLIFNAGKHLERGFPIQETSNTGYSRYLVDYRKGEGIDPGLFTLPADYGRFTLEVNQPVVQ
jgi:hypothetical protein